MNENSKFCIFLYASQIFPIHCQRWSKIMQLDCVYTCYKAGIKHSYYNFFLASNVTSFVSAHGYFVDKKSLTFRSKIYVFFIYRYSVPLHLRAWTRRQNVWWRLPTAVTRSAAWSTPTRSRRHPRAARRGSAPWSPTRFPAARAGFRIAVVKASSCKSLGSLLCQTIKRKETKTNSEKKFSWNVKCAKVNDDGDDTCVLSS